MVEHQKPRTVGPRLLTIADLSDLLRVSRSTIYELIRRGELVPIRVSERIRFSPEDIDAYVERRREESGP